MSEDWSESMDIEKDRASWITHHSSVSLPEWLEECLPDETSEDYSEESLTLLKVYYARWLDLLESYHHQTDNFLMAFLFISKHPAFWTRRGDAPTYSWKTTGHHMDLWFQVVCDMEGNASLFFETGGHVEPHYNGTSHDTRLDTVSRTYEEGIISLAKAVNKIFNADGTYRVPPTAKST